MKFLVLAWVAALLAVSISPRILADEEPGSARPSARPSRSKEAESEAKMRRPEPKARFTGVRATDPSRVGQTDTAGALSTDNASSMGLGLSFQFGKRTEPVRKEPLPPGAGSPIPSKSSKKKRTNY